MNRLLIIIFFLLLEMTSYTQVKKGINIQQGNSVDFVFRSLSEIKNGKTLGAINGYTKVYIYFDTVGSTGLTGWELYVKANTSQLDADFGSLPMDLDKIEITCTVTDGGNAGATISNVPLTVGDNLIATGLVGDGMLTGAKRDVNPLAPIVWNYLEWNVAISYACGVPGGLLGISSDKYYTDLILFIKEY